MVEMLNYRDAAKLLGIPIGTLYSWVASGRVSYVRLGPRLVRFQKDTLEGLIRRNTILTQQQPVDNKEPAYA